MKITVLTIFAVSAVLWVGSALTGMYLLLSWEFDLLTHAMHLASLVVLLLIIMYVLISRRDYLLLFCISALLILLSIISIFVRVGSLP